MDNKRTISLFITQGVVGTQMGETGHMSNNIWARLSGGWPLSPPRPPQGHYTDANQSKCELEFHRTRPNVGLIGFTTLSCLLETWLGTTTTRYMCLNIKTGKRFDANPRRVNWKGQKRSRRGQSEFQARKIILPTWKIPRQPTMVCLQSDFLLSSLRLFVMVIEF